MISGGGPARGLTPLLLLVAGLTSPAFADDSATELTTITITAPGLSRDLIATPAAVSVIDGRDLHDGRQALGLDEALNRVPGALFQNRYNPAQNLRISIRGFGARAPFGVRGIRLRVDGLPETLPDGQSQVDTIDLESVERIELIRGPAAAVYGNAAGGVIDVSTADRLPDGRNLELRGQGGSDGFRRLGARGAFDGDPLHGHVSAWDMKHDGWRAQSRTKKRLAQAKLIHDAGTGRRHAWLLTAYDQPLGEDPGGLTRAEVDADRRRAAPAALALDAGQRVDQQRVGWVFTDAASLPGELGAHAFYTRRDFEQQLPFAGASLVGFDRAFFGAGLDYTARARIGMRPLHYTIGVDAARQRDDRYRFAVDGGGAVGAQLQDAIETATASGIFAQADLGLTPFVDATLAGRVDRVRLAIDDRFTPDGAASGSRNYDEFSLSAGIGWQWRPLHRVYANAGSAFETPTFTEFYDPAQPAQGFDPSLEPQRAQGVETGLKGWVGGATRYEVALFAIRTKDEIVQIASDPNRYANAARTRREGVELALVHELSSAVTLTGAYTAAHYRFRSFTGAANDPVAGRQLPGLPRQQVYGELAWRAASGVYVIGDLLYIGSRYADNENTVPVAGHVVMNVRAGRVWQAGRTAVEVFAGIHNLADRDYFSNLRVNAGGGRYFEPAPGRNGYAGLSMSY